MVSYRRERQTVETKYSGMGSNQVYKSNWFAYDAMKFMFNAYTPKRTKSTPTKVRHPNVINRIYLINYINILVNSSH